MSEGVGIIVALAIIAFLIWLVGKLISIALFLVIAVPIYIVLGIYAGIKFIAMSTFIALDKLFYLGFDAPVIAVWVFWGLVIGAAIQGCREMKIYGRKRTGVLIAVTPVLLLVLVGALKITGEPPDTLKINTTQELPGASENPVNLDSENSPSTTDN